MALVKFEAAVLQLADALRARSWRMATAESCTGGLIAAACTAVAGSSDWFERGFVTYSNEAKAELLGVDPALIAAQGAVSEAVALAMLRGALGRSPVQLSAVAMRQPRARRASASCITAGSKLTSAIASARRR